jgi:hypothetical protein
MDNQEAKSNPKQAAPSGIAHLLRLVSVTPAELHFSDDWAKYGKERVLAYRGL